MKGMKSMRDKTVIIDTREKMPYEFSFKGFKIERGMLNVGDYSISGMENEFTIERKSLNDFANRISKFGEYINQVNSMVEYSGVLYLLVECTVNGLIEKCNNIKSSEVISRVLYMQSRGVTPLFCDTRFIAESICAKILQNYMR